MNRLRMVIGIFVAAGLAGISAFADGITFTWTGADPTDSNNWFQANNWDQTQVPGAGDIVIIDTATHTNITLTNSTAPLATFTMTNGTVLTFNGWDTTLLASNVYILNGCTVTHGTNISDSAAVTNRVLIHCTNLWVGAGGAINVDGKGYAAYQGPGKSGSADGAGRFGGAGYGGRGGNAENGGAPGSPYGSTNAPILPGSGGGQAVYGGSGGGAVRIDASSAVTVEGSISANGANGVGGATGPNNAGGSGGAIYITCATFAGGSAGVVQAKGGNAGLYNNNAGEYYSSGGGGGRLAVQYASASVSPGFRFSASYGRGSATDGRSAWKWTINYPDGYRLRLPAWGSLWLSDASLLSATPYAGLFSDVNLYLGSGDAWSASSLTLTNNTLGLAADGFQLSVTGDLAIGTNATLRVGFESNSLAAHVDCGGRLSLTNGGRLHLYSGNTNGMPGAYGALLSVTGGLSIANGSVLYLYAQPTNGGAPLIRAASVQVATSAVVDACARGFQAEAGPGKGVYSSYRSGGGGYGGKGGRGDNAGAVGGPPYGVTNAPVQPGSGAGYAGIGGRGGGVIRMEVTGGVTIDGTLTADGVSSEYDGPGGGAGGGIFITCASFNGGTGGMVRAIGAEGHSIAGSIYYGGGGGGGRVAIGIGVSDADRDALLANQSVAGLYPYYQHGPFAGRISVTNGLSSINTTPDGAVAGTALFLTPATAFTVVGDPANYDSPAPVGYGTVLDQIRDSTLTNSVTSPVDEAAGARHACAGWFVRDADGGAVANGGSTQAVFQLTTNMTLTWQWTNEYQLVVSAAANGTVNGGTVNGWYTNALVVTGILATADGGYNFALWTGDVPAGHETDNPLTVTMNQARTMQASFASANGVTKLWTGSGAWETGGNWSPAGMPSALDTAIVGQGTVLVANARQVASLVVSNGGTLLFTNWTTALTVSNDMTVLGGGQLTAAGPFTDAQMSNRVNLACSTFTLAAGGLINVDGRGYAPGYGPGHGSTSTRAGGAGYGGRGGYGENQDPRGSPYGATNAPVQPGSGGGNTSYGGAGGGAVRIAATGTVTIAGTISADGGLPYSDGPDPSNGGGSGGAIYITCQTFAGSAGGTLRARGGRAGWYNGAAGSYYSGGGGGGRLALQYTSATAAPGFVFSTTRGHGYSSDGRPSGMNPVLYPDVYRQWPATVGTLYLPDTALLATNPAGLFSDVNLYISGITAWAAGALTVTNGAFAFADDNFHLTVAGNLLVGGGGSLGVGSESLASGAVVQCGGDLIVTNGGQLHIYSGVTNAAPANYGGLCDVSGQVAVGPQSWIYPYSQGTDGGSVLFRMGDLNVSTNGGFNAAGRGYAANQGRGKGATDGSRAGGGGYGGRGGYGEDSQPGGSPYGSTNAPLEAGSGGGFAGAGAGGGVIRIEAAGAVNLDGTLKADGVASISPAGGGGAGGAVFVQATWFSGSATASLKADGGEGGYFLGTKYSGEGGGGRIAVWYGVTDVMKARLLAGENVDGLIAGGTYPRYVGAVSVTNGLGKFVNDPVYSGTVGSEVFLTVLVKGTIITLQ